MFDLFVAKFLYIFTLLIVLHVCVFAAWQTLVITFNIERIPKTKYWFDYRSNKFLKRFYASLYEMTGLLLLIMFAAGTIWMTCYLPYRDAWLLEMAMLTAAVYFFFVSYDRLEKKFFAK